MLIATTGETVSRIGVIGPVAPDYFAENVDDALQRLGHVLTSLARLIPAAAAGLSTAREG